MFTGIIRHVGLVKGTRDSAAGKVLTVDLGPLAHGLAAGDSVAVNGACLTASSIAPPVGQFDVIAETLNRTTLGGLRTGGRVNLERALKLGESLDGHLVQGHVDGVAKVRAVARQGRQEIEFDGDRSLTAEMVTKGSVAIDGVSLTLVEVAAGRFSVALIPTTLAETALGQLRPGDEVNIETDLIGKYVRRCLQETLAACSDGVTMDKLRQAGF